MELCGCHILGFYKVFILIPHGILIKELAWDNVNKAHIELIKNWLTDGSQKGAASQESALTGSISSGRPQWSGEFNTLRVNSKLVSMGLEANIQSVVIGFADGPAIGRIVKEN